MGDQLLTAKKAMDYLGADEANEAIISELLACAIANLSSMVGRDVSQEKDVAIVNDALRAMVYIDYYVRSDKPGNLEFIQRNLSGTITRLKLQKPSQEVPPDAM